MTAWWVWGVGPPLPPDAKSLARKSVQLQKPFAVISKLLGLAALGASISAQVQLLGGKPYRPSHGTRPCQLRRARGSRPARPRHWQLGCRPRFKHWQTISRKRCSSSSCLRSTSLCPRSILGHSALPDGPVAQPTHDGLPFQIGWLIGQPPHDGTCGGGELPSQFYRLHGPEIRAMLASGALRTWWEWCRGD